MSEQRAFKEVRYCKTCLEPDTRPGASFDDEGICLPCNYTQSLDSIDWNQRRKELEDIAKWGREHRSFGYDCIIGVSGGKDSLRLAFYARDELGLRPLLVSCTYPPEQQTERGADNLDNLIAHGFDTHVVSPGPKTWKKLMRQGLVEFGNIFKSTELALYSSVARAAVAYNIRLAFFGENPALSFGGSVGSLDGNANRLKEGHTLGGGDLTPWLKSGASPGQLYWYRYPSDRDMERADLRLVYLGYYIRDFNDMANGRFAMERGLKVREGRDALPEETGSLNAFECLDDDFVHVNQYLKYLKLGFGKVTQQASVMVRLGEISQKEGVALVRKYDGKVSKRYIKRLCDYLEITEEAFHEVEDAIRDRDIWQLNNRGEWELRYKLR